MTLRDAWTRYATWPLIARVVVAVAILGACVLVADYCGAWWQNRETDRVLAEVTERDKVIDEQRRRIDNLTGQNRALEVELGKVREENAQLAAQAASLEAQGKQQDANVQGTRKAYRQSRRGGAAPTDDLDNRLRRAYPSP